jgi:hypothetical protein
MIKVGQRRVKRRAGTADGQRLTASERRAEANDGLGLVGVRF